MTYGYAMMLLNANIPHDVIGIDQIDGYKVVLTGGFYWPEQDVERLLAYIADGGIVIASNTRFASRDENGNEVNRPALRRIKTNGTHSLEKGKFIFFTDYLWWKIWAQRDTTATQNVLDIVKSISSPITAPEMVQVLPYVNANGQIVVHILNLEFLNGNFTSRSDVQITLLLPQEMSATGKKMIVLSPDFEHRLELPPVGEDSGILRFTLPSLYIWDVVILE